MSYHRLAGAALGAASSPLVGRATPTRTDVLRAPLAVRRRAVSQNRSKVAAQLQQLGLGDKVVVNVDGSLQLKNILADLDRAVGQMLRQPLPDFGVDPVSGRATDKGKKVGTTLVDSLPFSASQKAAMKNNPVSFMLGIFTPLVNVFGEALTEVMDKGLTAAERQQKTAKDKGLSKGGYVYDLSGFPTFLGSKGRAINIALVQAGDDMFDAASQQQIKLIRTVVAFCVLFFKKWIELHAALARKGVEFVFGKDIVVTQSTTRFDENTPATAEVVDVLPRGVEGPISNRGNALDPSTPSSMETSVWYLNKGTLRAPKFHYFKLSTLGLYDAKARALRASVVALGLSKVVVDQMVIRSLGTRPQSTFGSMYAVERGTMGNYTSGLGAADGGVVEGAAAEATTMVFGVPVANSLILGVIQAVLGKTALIVLGIVGLSLGFNLKVTDKGFELEKAPVPTSPPVPPSQAPPSQLDTQSAPPAALPVRPPASSASEGVSPVVLLGGAAALGGLFLLMRRR